MLDKFYLMRENVGTIGTMIVTDNSLLPFVLMNKSPAFLPSSLFSGMERSTKILYDIRKLEHFAVLFVYIDKEQLDKLVFDKGA